MTRYPICQLFFCPHTASPLFPLPLEPIFLDFAYKIPDLLTDKVGGGFAHPQTNWESNRGPFSIRFAVLQTEVSICSCSSDQYRWCRWEAGHCHPQPPPPTVTDGSGALYWPCLTGQLARDPDIYLGKMEASREDWEMEEVSVG